MPTNLYGPGDNYDLQTSHVLPALIRRFHEAKEKGDRTVTLWGTGAPRREFLYSDDMAAACVHLLTLPQDRLGAVINDREPPLVNVGCGEDLPIRDLASWFKEPSAPSVAIEWDRTKPDGTPRKLLDVSRLVGARLAARASVSKTESGGRTPIICNAERGHRARPLRRRESRDSHMLRDAVPVRPSNVSK